MTQPTIDNTITLLTKIRDQLGSEYLAYWVAPNAILTLSGARAYMDGVFWDDDNKGLLDTWSAEIAESVAVINNSTDVLLSRSGIKQGRGDNKYAGYDLVLENGMEYSLDHTHMLHNVNIDQLREFLLPDEFMKPMTDDLKSQDKFHDYSDEDIAHIAFGILVGYPDKAIIGSVDTRRALGEKAETELVDAKIEYANYYDCPQPVYDYPKNFVDEPSITAHEKLWSGILQDYYSSDFHHSLSAIQQFQDKLKEIGALQK